MPENIIPDAASAAQALETREQIEDAVYEYTALVYAYRDAATEWEAVYKSGDPELRKRALIALDNAQTDKDDAESALIARIFEAIQAAKAGAAPQSATQDAPEFDDFDDADDPNAASEPDETPQDFDNWMLRNNWDMLTRDNEAAIEAYYVKLYGRGC